MWKLNQFWRYIGLQLGHPTGGGAWFLGYLMVILNHWANKAAVVALQDAEHDHVLEIACGPGAALRMILNETRASQVVGLDMSWDMLRQAARRNRAALDHRRVTLVCGDVSSLPFRSDTFDGALVVNAAYFFQNATPFCELHRTLKAGGRLVIYLTSADSMRHWPFVQPETHRFYDPEDIRKMLRAAGFSIDCVSIKSVHSKLGVCGHLIVAQRNCDSSNLVRRSFGVDICDLAGHPVS